MQSCISTFNDPSYVPRRILYAHNRLQLQLLLHSCVKTNTSLFPLDPLLHYITLNYLTRNSHPLSPSSALSSCRSKVLHLCGGIIALFWCSWDILALPLSWSWAWCCTSHRGDDALLTSSHRDPALKLKLKTITINIDRHAKRYHIISILLTMKVIAAALLTLLSTYTVTGKSDGKSKSGVECNQETIRRLWQCKHLLLLSLSSYHSSSHSYTHQSPTELINSR